MLIIQWCCGSLGLSLGASFHITLLTHLWREKRRGSWSCSKDSIAAANPQSPSSSPTTSKHSISVPQASTSQTAPLPSDKWSTTTSETTPTTTTKPSTCFSPPIGGKACPKSNSSSTTATMSSAIDTGTRAWHIPAPRAWTISGARLQTRDSFSLIWSFTWGQTPRCSRSARTTATKDTSAWTSRRKFLRPSKDC